MLMCGLLCKTTSSWGSCLKFLRNFFCRDLEEVACCPRSRSSASESSRTPPTWRTPLPPTPARLPDPGADPDTDRTGWSPEAAAAAATPDVVEDPVGGDRDDDDDDAAEDRGLGCWRSSLLYMLLLALLPEKLLLLQLLLMLMLQVLMGHDLAAGTTTLLVGIVAEVAAAPDVDEDDDNDGKVEAEGAEAIVADGVPAVGPRVRPPTDAPETWAWAWHRWWPQATPADPAMGPDPAGPEAPANVGVDADADAAGGEAPSTEEDLNCCRS